MTLKTGYRVAYKAEEQWFAGEIINLYSLIAVVDPDLPDGTRHCPRLSELFPPF